MLGYRSLPIDQIDVGDRFRLLSREHAEQLGVSYSDYGRTAPIIVRPHPEAPGRYLLVAGMHRLMGARAAGLAEIEAEVRNLTAEEAREVEIAENVHRFELTALDRMRSLAELARLYEARNGKNRGGRPRKNRGQLGHGFAARFSEEVQRRTGISERVIRRDVATAAELAPEVVALLAATPVANNAAQLQRLAREPAAHRTAIARALAEGRASTVQAARAAIGLETPAERDPQERVLNQLVELWGRADARTKRRFAEHLRLKGEWGQLRSRPERLPRVGEVIGAAANDQADDADQGGGRCCLIT